MSKLKELIESRNTEIEKMNNFKNIALTRAITEEENNELDNIIKNIKGLDNRIKILDLEERKLIDTKLDELPVSEELRSFLKDPVIHFRNFGSGAGKTFKQAEQGAIVPSTLSNKIIEKVMKESEIVPMLTKYSITGELIIPKFDRSTMSAAFYDEFAEVVESNAGFTSIKLVTHRVSSLIKVSNVLINNVNFDIEGYLVKQLVDVFKDFLEKCVLQGESTKFDSLFTASSGMTITGVKKDGWTIDGMIDLQLKLPTAYQSRAVFIMNKDTLTSLRKLKDTTGQYYVLPDVTKGFGYQLLNTRIITSDYAPANKVFYGDLGCYAFGVSDEMNMQVLTEKYATQYAVGVVVHGMFGGKIIDDQGIAIFDGTAITG